MESTNNPESFRKNTVERLNRITHSAAEIIANRSVKVETEHLGLFAEIDNGMKFYVHAGNESLSVAQSWELMQPDQFVVFSLRTLIGRNPGDSPKEDIIVKIDKSGIHMAEQTGETSLPEVVESDDCEWEQPSMTQVLGLSVILSRINRKTTQQE